MAAEIEIERTWKLSFGQRELLDDFSKVIAPYRFGPRVPSLTLHAITNEWSATRCCLL
jgi:hypothetical protein